MTDRKDAGKRFLRDTRDAQRASRDGEPISSCPYAPGDPAGKEWRQAWLTSEAGRRNRKDDDG